MDEIQFESFSEATIIDGQRFVDDRGVLMFVNNLKFNFFKRFYVVQNHRQGFIRAWHGHLKEAKFLFPISGAFQVGVVKIDEFGNSALDLEAKSFVIDASSPKGLYIPPGFANGTKSLTLNGQLLIFSTASLSESSYDDIRFPYDTWDIWQEKFR